MMCKFYPQLVLVPLAVGSIGFATIARAFESPIACIPDTVRNPSLESEYVRNEGSFFYYSGTLESGELAVFLIETDSEGCRLRIEPGNFDVFLHDVVDFDAERALWIGDYQKAILSVGGVERFQELFNDSHHPDVTLYRSEAEVAALKELEIDLPDRYNLVSGDEEIEGLLLKYRQSPFIYGERFINTLHLVENYAVVSWFRRDSAEGLAFASKESDEWEILGFVDSSDEEITPNLLFERFEIPLDVASKLLEAE